MHETSLRVRYAETDAMGVVYHSNYFQWMEVGRTELFRSLELPYSVIEAQGVYFPVVEAQCRYRKPAHYDDLVSIKTQVESFSAAKMTFSYQIYRINDETLLVEGKTIHAFTNNEGRPINIKKVPLLYKKLCEIIC